MTKAQRNRLDIIEMSRIVPCGTDDIRVDVDVRVKGLTDEELATVESFVQRAATLAAKHAAAGVIAARNPDTELTFRRLDGKAPPGAILHHFEKWKGPRR